MNLVAADVSPLHLIQNNVRADSRRLLRLDSIRPQAERYSFLPLPANRGEGWLVAPKPGEGEGGGEGHVFIV
jgi:hypothetical protein